MAKLQSVARARIDADQSSFLESICQEYGLTESEALRICIHIAEQNPKIVAKIAVKISRFRREADNDISIC